MLRIAQERSLRVAGCSGCWLTATRTSTSCSACTRRRAPTRRYWGAAWAVLAGAVEACALPYAMPYDQDEFAAVQAQARAAGTRVAIDVEMPMLARAGDGKRRVADVSLRACPLSAWNRPVTPASTSPAPWPPQP